MKAIGIIFGECLNYKSGLRILIWPLEVPFFLVRKWPLLPKVPIFDDDQHEDQDQDDHNPRTVKRLRGSWWGQNTQK